MIAEIKKLNLIAMMYDRDKILNVLERTGAVEIKQHAEEEFTHALSGAAEELRADLAAAEQALAVLTDAVRRYTRDHKVKSALPEDGFEVSYSEFMSAEQKRAENSGVIAQIFCLRDRRNELIAERNRTLRLSAAAKAYDCVRLPFSAFSETDATVTRLGTVNPNVWETLAPALENGAVCARNLGGSDTAVIAVTAHKSNAAETDRLLSEAGFVPCPYHDDVSGGEQYAALQAKIRQLDEEREKTENDFYILSDHLRDLKIYCDYLGFGLEKREASEKLLATDSTFLLEAYVPAEAEMRVKEALQQTTDALFLEFSEVPADEMPPTLYKNNAVVENFEAVTDMYSVPNARELDPSTVMSFFYSLFLGFIMADVGYGVLMLIGGGLIWWRNRGKGSTLARLAGVFAVGGIFALIWGLLFNSFFGVPLAGMPALLPDPQKDMWTLAGINMPSVLIISMLIGIVHLFVGYVCRALQCWRRRLFWDGVWDGVVWALFSVGVLLAVLGFVEEFNLNVLALVGGITAGASLLVAMLTAGRKEKIIGKFTKGFGAAYGVINYVSDVLSYARLYGLMLSGVVIANLISTYSVQFMTSGNFALVILGIVLILFGHVFNLAISLLGAYIHDARLQYVEFFGRFFEGEGEPFTPLGSAKKYVRVPRGTLKTQTTADRAVAVN